MIRIFLLSLNVLISPIVSRGQQLDASTGTDLEWNEYYDLQWHDFQGKPDENSNGDAGAAVRIKAKPYRLKGEVRYDVVATFNRQRSWARDTSRSLLAHERLHFDIAELYARKIRKRISELDRRGVNNTKVYNAAIRELLRESNEADERYDLETLHGVISAKQKLWSDRVNAEINALKDYRKPRRVIGG